MEHGINGVGLCLHGKLNFLLMKKWGGVSAYSERWTPANVAMTTKLVIWPNPLYGFVASFQQDKQFLHYYHSFIALVATDSAVYQFQFSSIWCRLRGYISINKSCAWYHYILQKISFFWKKKKENHEIFLELLFVRTIWHYYWPFNK